MHQFSLVRKKLHIWLKARAEEGQKWAWDRNIVENIRHNHHWSLMAVGSEKEQELRLEVTDEIQKYVGSLRKVHCWICVAVSMKIKCSVLTYHAEYTGTSLELPRYPCTASAEVRGTVERLISPHSFCKTGKTWQGRNQHISEYFLLILFLNTKTNLCSDSCKLYLRTFISSWHLNFCYTATCFFNSYRGIWIIFI